MRWGEMFLEWKLHIQQNLERAEPILKKKKKTAKWPIFEG